MEGEPKFEVKEAGSDWRQLKEDAPEKARELIEEIESFADMEPEEQMSKLDTLIEQLAEDNANRFMASEVARQRAIIEEENRHRRQMETLEAA